LFPWEKHIDLLILALLVLIWTVLLVLKSLFPNDYPEILRRPVVYYHQHISGIFKQFTTQRLATHFLWLMWIGIYLAVTRKSFPEADITGLWLFVTGYYLLDNLLMLVLSVANRDWSAVHFLRLIYTRYSVFWLSVLSFAVYFVPGPIRWKWIILTLGFAWFALDFGYNALKLGRLEWRIKRIYIILYLCALEILPVLVIVSYLM
jgi:hypothetical protein